ncbi:MAG: hypothetical protein L0220_06810, partial [Acidobacteria bacterium]|nr:hypothetical protein [Acidobacteriota bacterium]
LSDLNECGIAQVHFDELFADRRLWDELSPQVDRWSKSDAIRENERRYLEGYYREAKWKEYIMMMTQEEGETFSIGSPLLQLGLQPVILDIVNSYFGMQAKLFHLDVWKTIPLSCDGPLTGSQRWHRDPEDLKLVKVFLYLSDVDQAAGPLHYIRYSRRGDEYGNFCPQKLPYGRVVPSDEVEKKIPRTDWTICSAPAGTFVFVDTTGLHMGGRASKNQRLFATWGFASQGMIWPRCFKLDSLIVPQGLPAAARYALFD